LTGLRERINLFETFVGALQPILSQIPRAISAVAFADRNSRDRETSALVEELKKEASEVENVGFDIDAITEGDIEDRPRAPALYDLNDLERILAHPDLLPPGCEVKPAGDKDHAYLAPGMESSIRVTTDPEFYEQHADSVELWSPGSHIFPKMPEHEAEENVTKERFRMILA
jgi:hypothetical protein